MNKKGGLLPFVISIITILLFSFLIITFSGNFISEYNPSSPVLDDKYGLNDSLDDIRSSLDNFVETSNSIREQLANDKPTAVDYLFLIFKGAFYIPWTFLSFITTGVFSLISIIFTFMGGAGAGELITISLTILSSVLIITIVLLIVKAIRTGETEK